MVPRSCTCWSRSIRSAESNGMQPGSARIWLDITGVEAGSDAAVFATRLAAALRGREGLDVRICIRTPGLQPLEWSKLERTLSRHSISRLRLPNLASFRRMARRLPSRGRAALGRFLRLQAAACAAWQDVFVRTLKALGQRTPADRLQLGAGDTLLMLAPVGDVSRFAVSGARLVFLAVEALVLHRPDLVAEESARAATIWLHRTLPHLSSIITFSPDTASRLRRADCLSDPPVIAGADSLGRTWPARANKGASFILVAAPIGEAGLTRQFILAWRLLLDQMPTGTVPILQLAGPLTALSADVLEQLRNSLLLNGMVRVLAYPNPDQMTELVANCLFSIAPASHSGWGRATSDSLAGEVACLSAFDAVGAQPVDATDVSGLVRAIRAWLEVPPPRPAKPSRRWSDVADDVMRVIGL